MEGDPAGREVDDSQVADRHGARLPDGTTVVAKQPTTLGSVTVTGEPSELVLFCIGRQAVADVQLDGEAEAVEQLRNASFGV